jgi:hypothetical protein
MSRLSRLLPGLIAGLGVVHLVYVVAESPGVVRDMLADGFVGASNDYRRDFVTWFFIGGMVLLMLAATARWAIRVTGRFPRPLAVGLLAIGLFDTLLEPDGGGWLLLLLGALATYDAYRSAPSGEWSAAERRGHLD